MQLLVFTFMSFYIRFILIFIDLNCLQLPLAKLNGLQAALQHHGSATRTEKPTLFHCVRSFVIIFKYNDQNFGSDLMFLIILS